ncbi:MAG: alpha/beta fold hydrolase [Bacteroidia bacterium]|nr:alpha/beta fold hydrolase [Bacteroidia bacterium]
MIKLRYSLQILALLLISGSAVAQDDTKEVNPYKKLSKSFFGAVKRDIPNRNEKFFDTSFYAKISSAQTDRTLDNFRRVHGVIVAIEKTEVDTQGCKMATVTSIKSGHGKFLWYLYFDQAQYIQKLVIDTFSDQWFYKPKPISNINFTRKEVLFESNPFIKLPGSLYVPNNLKKPWPAVVLVHGSGPHDRNMSIGRNKIFLDMALELVQKGITVLIYDKRTYVYQYHDPFPMDSMDFQSETIDDAVAAVNFLKQQPGIDTSRIYIAGHSQGALCAPLMAKKCKVKGLLLLAAPGRSLLDMIPEQLDYIASLQTKKDATAEAQTNALKWQVGNALKPDLTLQSRTILPFGARPKYWLFDRNYKVLDVAKTLTLPILLIQGGRDYNVTKKDYDLWGDAMKGKPNFKAVYFDELDHMFFIGEGKARPEDVTKVNHVSQKVTDKMADFINSK